MYADSYSYFPHLFIQVLGVGEIKPNQMADGQDEDSEEVNTNGWMKLLNGNKRKYSLKPWKEVMKANKSNLSLALREIMRQAWCK
jgi:hypothetical protein